MFCIGPMLGTQEPCQVSLLTSFAPKLSLYSLCLSFLEGLDFLVRLGAQRGRGWWIMTLSSPPCDRDERNRFWGWKAIFQLLPENICVGMTGRCGVIKAMERSFHTVFFCLGPLRMANVVAFIFVQVLRKSQVGRSFWSLYSYLAGGHSGTSHLWRWITRNFVLGNWMYSNRICSCLHGPTQLHSMDQERYVYKISWSRAPLTPLSPSWSTATTFGISVSVSPRV